MERIVLASQSPRRRQLLEWAEINFDVLVSNADESFPPGMSIADIPVHIARNKAAAVKKSTGELRTILAADTLVILDGEVIGKPADRQEAISILSRLSGNMHTVITGVVIQSPQINIEFADQTHVWFHVLAMADIEYYVDKYKPYDKAGAYAIQEWIGVTGIKKIEGDFYNVMGLPVSRVVKALIEIQH